MKTIKTIIITLFFVSFFALSAQAFFTPQDVLKKDSQLPKPSHTDEDLIQKELKTTLEEYRSGTKIFDTKLQMPKYLQTLFGENLYKPIWDYHKSSDSRMIRELMEVIEESEANALNPDDYHYHVFKKYLGKVTDFTDIAKMELLLTDSLFKLINDILNGRVVPKQVQEEWHLPVAVKDIYPIVKEMIEENHIERQVSKLYPQSEAYEKMKEALAFYKKLKKKGTMPLVPKMKKKIEPGERGAHILALRARLAFTGDLHRDAKNHIELYDDALKEAVTRFQSKHGLNDDGVIGLYTFAALNKPISDIIKQIKVNMERMRWLVDDEAPEEYIYINIPDFKLRVIEKGKTKLQMRTVVGNYKWQTPIFNDEMEYVVINPKWNVPPKILKKETLPKVQKNPDYIKNKNFVVYKKENGRFKQVNPDSVDWSQADPKNYHFSQRSGGGNALGRLKFIFPNEFSVYLHDTPSKSLFKRDIRAYSHGCIRLEKPLELAKLLLKEVKDKKEWNEERIKETISTAREVSVILPQKIPVRLRYMTAWIDEEGELNFRKDVYLYDKKLAKELNL